MGAGHGHDGDHHHGAGGVRAFAWVTLLNLGYTILEAAYGFATNSLALLSDALHNLGDVLGLGLAWGAAAIARRAPTERHTYGWRRATLLSPLANALVLAIFSGALAWEAVRRFLSPPEVPGVVAVHHVHIWSLGAGEIAMTAHLVRSDASDHDAFIDGVSDDLNERFGINHPTLQIEFGTGCHDLHDNAPHH